MIIYRTPGPWGEGTDHDLLAAEIDGNFWDLDQRVTNLVDNPPEAISIETIALNAQGQLVITLTNGTVEGPFTMPIFIPDYRGEWVGATHYDQGDQVTVTGQGTYQVLQTHDSVAPFDPNRVIGGNPVYALIAPPGAAGAPGADGADGATGPAGPEGPRGNFRIDASGTFAQRDAYDAQPEGFTYLSTDGDGLGGTFGTIFIMGSGGLADWTGPFQWEGQGPAGATGATGATGPAGADGADGANFDVDARGSYAGRSAYDTQATGFSYLSLDGSTGAGTPAVIFFKLSATSGDWGPPTPFQGPQGLTGPTGPAGPQGDPGPTGAPGTDGVNFNVNATGTFAQRSTYNNQAEGFRYLSTNGDGSGNAVTGAASIYIRETVTAGVWSARIPFQGPKGATGPAGPPGTPGTQGPPGANGVGVPAGGTTGQVLSKASNSNFDTQWSDPGGASYPIESLIVALSDETTAITTGTAKLTMRMPYKGQIIGVPRANVNTVSSSGTPTVDINKNGTTILSTKLTIDASEKTSVTATAAAVVSDANFNDDDEFTFDIDVAGTGAKGLKVLLRIQQVP